MAAEELLDAVGLIQTLNSHSVDYIVIGGLAAARYGVIRATRDLDLVYERSWDNVQRLAAALRALKARDATSTETPLDPEVLVRRVDLNLKTEHGALHLLNNVPGVPDYRHLLPGEIIDFEGEQLRVCSLADLRTMKEKSGRPKDLMDLAELDALRDPQSKS